MINSCLKKIRDFVLLTVFNLAIIVFLLIFLEGLCDIIAVVGKDHHALLAERSYTQYDPDLGWISIPNTFIKDMYGEGIALQINSQGFRAHQDFSYDVPKGKIRLILSGDSFTFGYGVDNDHTWGNILTQMDGQIETINMGQGGYGLDQSYLWYRRDGVKFKHQIHIFAVNPSAFVRYREYILGGYPKPTLSLENGDLIVHHTPVPRRPYFVPWVTENLQVLKQLSIYKFIAIHFVKKDTSIKKDMVHEWNLITIKILEDLQIINKQENSTLVVAFLPRLKDLNGNEELRNFLEENLNKRGIRFIDLTDDFRELSSQDLKAMFISYLKYPYSAGHYSVKGNQWVASVIYQRLKGFNLLASPGK